MHMQLEPANLASFRGKKKKKEKKGSADIIKLR